MMVKKIIILGIGGNCIDILDSINAVNTVEKDCLYECVGFLDDNRDLHGKSIHGVKVLGSLESASSYSGVFFTNGIGSPFNFWRRNSIIATTGIPLERFQTIVHPTASVSPMAKLGRGVAILQNVTVASGARIGNHVTILPNTVISHDDVIGDYSCIAGGVCICGGVIVGEACYLGAGCAIKGNVTLGKYSLIGMGSMVLRDVPEGCVMVGNPARFLRRVKDDHNCKTHTVETE